MGLYQNRIVVKVGTSTLTNELGKPEMRSFDRLACVLADVQNMGYEVILVSSGAIAVGVDKLRMEARPESMRLKQAAAAVGQCSIMFLYDKFFSEYGKTIAQILLNAADIEEEEKKENLINTFDALLERGLIPVVNENDTVSTYEIKFGDNVRLSAIVSALFGADLLVLLSDIDGLYSDDPKMNPDAEFISQVDELSDALMSMGKSTSGSDAGTGGMAAKLYAAKIAAGSGTDMVIANGDDVGVIWDILEGREVGTLFTAHRSPDFTLLDYIESVHP